MFPALLLARLTGKLQEPQCYAVSNDYSVLGAMK